MTTTTRTSFTSKQVFEALDEIAPILREEAMTGAEQGNLTDRTVDALHRARVFGIWTPKELGGTEMNPSDSVKVIEKLAYNDPSAAWVSMAGALATGTGGAYLGDEAIPAIFTDSDRLPVIAGQGTRPGRAVTVPGGYELSGDWGFGSGLRHGQWIHTLGIIEETGEARIFVLPVDKAEFKLDSWDVLGLRATASIEYSVRDVFVPEAFTHVGPTEVPLRGGDLFTLGIIHFGNIGHSSWALGISRRMLDELKGLIKAKAGRAGSLAENTNFHAQYGNLEAEFWAAHSLVHTAWRDVTETVERGEKLTFDQKTKVRLALYHATWTAENIANKVQKFAGTQAIWPTELQMLFRDMHTGTKHASVSDSTIELCGKALAGLAPEQDWLYMSLVPTRENS